MAVTGRIQIEGVQELRNKLRGMEAKVAKKILRQALRAGAKPIMAAAKQNAPHDTGLLMRSIKVRAGKRRKDSISVVVQTKDGDFKGETYYAAFIEYGYKRVPVFYDAKRGRLVAMKKGTRIPVPPKPFMRPAFDSTKDVAAAIIKRELAAGIEQAAKAKT